MNVSGHEGFSQWVQRGIAREQSECRLYGVILPGMCHSTYEYMQKAKRSHWKPPQMVPVLDENGTPIWVKGDYKEHYRVSG